MLCCLAVAKHQMPGPGPHRRPGPGSALGDLFISLTMGHRASYFCLAGQLQSPHPPTGAARLGRGLSSPGSHVTPVRAKSPGGGPARRSRSRRPAATGKRPPSSSSPGPSRVVIGPAQKSRTRTATRVEGAAMSRVASGRVATAGNSASGSACTTASPPRGRHSGGRCAVMPGIGVLLVRSAWARTWPGACSSPACHWRAGRKKTIVVGAPTDNCGMCWPSLKVFRGCDVWLWAGRSLTPQFVCSVCDGGMLPGTQ